MTTRSTPDSDERLTSKEVRSAYKAFHKDAQRLRDAGAALYPAHVDSAIATDDGISYPRTPPSVLVHNSLQSAASHLLAMREFCRTQGANRSTALSLLRPALMATTAAGWVLTGDTPRVRAHRAAALSNEHLKYERNFLLNINKIDGASDNGRLGSCEEKRAGLADWHRTSGLEVLRFNMTQSVEYVSAEVVPQHSAHLTALWNETSSAAHGYDWHIQGRTFGAGSMPVPGTAFAAFGLDLDHLTCLHAIMCVTEFTAMVMFRAKVMYADPLLLSSDEGSLTHAKYMALMDSWSMSRWASGPHP